MSYQYLKEIKEVFSSSKLMVLSAEISDLNETPISLFKKLCTDKKSFLLESAETVDKFGQYSYIGRNPFIEIKGSGNKVSILQKDESIEKQGSPLEIVKTLLDEYQMPFIHDLPDFIGGAVGYIGYDIIRNYEALGTLNIDDMKMPDIHLFLMEELFIYDHFNNKIIIVLNLPVSNDSEVVKAQGIERLKNIESEILNAQYSDTALGLKRKPKTYTSNETKESYMAKVEKAKEYIVSGDIFQVVLSQRFAIETKVDPFSVYTTLRKLNPSPYMFFIHYEDYTLVGSSPEMLVKVKDRLIETCPIAGTRPRGKTHEEDNLLAQQLLEDKKELAEHLMLIDLARNDVGKISAFGTVQLTNYMEIKKYSHVMHIVSNVVGQLSENNDIFDALSATLPAGTVSGAPKIRAMQIIDELENNKRGVYAGAVGCIGFNGNMDTCITIRTIVFKEDTAYIQAGAGIVADSNPESEYFETLRKAEALIEAIKTTEEDLL